MFSRDFLGTATVCTVLPLPSRFFLFLLPVVEDTTTVVGIIVAVGRASTYARELITRYINRQARKKANTKNAAVVRQDNNMSASHK